MLTVGDRIPNFDVQAVSRSLAVSAINGCGVCIEAHEKAVRKEGITAEQVQAAVRIAAVVNAAAAILDAEAVRDQALVALAA